ncbi:MAG: hypothetical protein KatS3mg114_1425 [Planctomycetaceae bacterium]|nr:MAG: hypothetical protein KatS3mg114_1425 [Planctomycetaceae bacterium]
MEPAGVLIVLGGLLGSAHCVGMCGVLSAGVSWGACTLGESARRQMLYSLGRLASYATLGGLAGQVGAQVSGGAVGWLGLTVLSWVAGWALLVVGWQAWRGPRGTAGATGVVPCALAWGLAPLLRSCRPWEVLAAGILTGLLPCGLVYAFVALAASRGSAVAGAVTMLLFGLGTLPAMLLSGMGLARWGLGLRQRWWRVAALAIMITGVLTLQRGTLAWERFRQTWTHIPASPPSVACPWCRPVPHPPPHAQAEEAP